MSVWACLIWLTVAIVGTHAQQFSAPVSNLLQCSRNLNVSFNIPGGADANTIQLEFQPSANLSRTGLVYTVTFPTVGPTPFGGGGVDNINIDLLVFPPVSGLYTVSPAVSAIPSNVYDIALSYVTGGGPRIFLNSSTAFGARLAHQTATTPVVTLPLTSSFTRSKSHL